jgi:hypothetical protein
MAFQVSKATNSQTDRPLTRMHMDVCRRREVPLFLKNRQDGLQWFGTTCHAILQPMIEHIANHDHVAAAPLPHTAKVRMVELCLPAAGPESAD